MLSGADPNNMTVAERSREVAELLAVGYRRLAATKLAEARKGRPGTVGRESRSIDSIRLDGAPKQSD